MTSLRTTFQRAIDIASVLVLIAALYVMARPGSPLRLAWAERQEAKEAAATLSQNWDSLRSEGYLLAAGLGPATVVMVTDYECPYCRLSEAVVDSAVKAGIPIGVLHLPIETIHPRARAAALFSVCSAAQGKFLEAHDYLTQGTAWQSDTSVWGRAAHSIGVVDTTRLLACMEAPATNAVLASHRKLAERVSVSVTPTFLSAINRVEGVPTVDALRALAARAP